MNRKDKCGEKWFFTERDGQPLLALGVQTHNSSTGTALVEKSLKVLEYFGGNTLEAPVYWNRVEQREGEYDFSQVQALIDAVREKKAHLVLLWFGMSKNGHPNYAPEYVKLHPEQYRLAVGYDGAPVASLSPHCAATLERDRAAFVRLMRFLKKYDGQEKTVLAVQIENEMGYSNTDRDYGAEAERAYQGEVPEALRQVSVPGAWDGGRAPQETLTGAESGKEISPWKKQFGRYSHEAFSAWHTARYVERMAQAGKEAYALPLYTNVMVGESGYEEAGLCYNAGAGVSRMLDIWKAAAPTLDLIAPDIYNPSMRDYRRICEAYAREDNPLFIPESPVQGESNALNALLAAAEYGAVGVACFGAESALDENGALNEGAKEIALTMRILAKSAPLLLRYHGSGRIHAFAQEEFEEYRYLALPEYHVTVRYTRCFTQNYGYTSDTKSAEGQKKIKSRGRAVLVQTAPHEFYFCGAGAALELVRRPAPLEERSYAQMRSRQATQLNFLSVEQGHFEQGEWVCDFIRNGDETNFAQYVLDGQMIRIRMNPEIGMGE